MCTESGQSLLLLSQPMGNALSSPTVSLHRRMQKWRAKTITWSLFHQWEPGIWLCIPIAEKSDNLDVEAHPASSRSEESNLTSSAFQLYAMSSSLPGVPNNWSTPFSKDKVDLDPGPQHCCSWAPLILEQINILRTACVIHVIVRQLPGRFSNGVFSEHWWGKLCLCHLWHFTES